MDIYFLESLWLSEKKIPELNNLEPKQKRTSIDNADLVILIYQLAKTVDIDIPYLTKSRHQMKTRLQFSLFCIHLKNNIRN